MSPASARTIEQTLKSNASTQRAILLARFFKTGKGEYGEGDKFMGIVVPNIRKVAKAYYQQVTFETVHELISSPYHEVRLCALIMLVYKYQRAQSSEPRAEIYNFYLSHTTYINNWDLVDLTAPNIVGDYLLHEYPHERLPLKFSNHSPLAIRHLPILIQLANSSSLWERRIAVLATFSFIRAGRHQEAFAIAELLLHHKHDLIHKAIGWMLREVGKRVGKDTLRGFLDEHASTMPRTMLRYAIEHFGKEERVKYMTIDLRITNIHTSL